MMYANKMAVAIKTNGRILKEFKDTVYVKFGSEYSVYMKNLNTTRALVNVYIDGTNITPSGLVVDPGCDVDLQRSLANGNLTTGNALKFIERTEGIEQHRGVKLEDGLVRIEFQFELPAQQYYTSAITTPIAGSGFKLTASGSAGNYGGAYGGGSNLTRGINSTVNNVSLASLSSAMATSASLAVPTYNDAGITVAGSKSTQSFSTTFMGAMDPEKHSIVLKLLGETPDNKPVLTPVTVKAKQKCTTCGHTNKATAQYCNKCGTALVIYA